LRRDLGFAEATALAVSMMLGAGIFVGPTLTAREFPNGAVILAIWVAGGLLSILGGYVFGKLAAMFPLSGGPYVYLRETFGPTASFFYAWMSFAVVGPVGMAALAIIFAQNLAILAPVNAWGVTLLASWCVVAFTFFNAIGVRTGGRVQVLLSGLKVALVVALLGILALVAWSGFSPGSPGLSAAPGQAAGTGRWAAALVGVIFAYGGWEYSVLAAEEVRDPSRTLPRALLAATSIVAVLYVAVTVAYLAALGPVGVASASALAPAAVAHFVPSAPQAVAVGVAISAAGTVNALVLLGPRATFAVARDRALPWLSQVSPRFGTPLRAIVVQALLAIAYLVTGTFLTIVTYDTVATALTITSCTLALLIVLSRNRRRAPLLASATAVVGLVFAAFLVTLILEDPWTAIIGVGIVACGAVPLLLLEIFGRKDRGGARMPRAADGTPTGSTLLVER
jgi:APA family basic amino acid/polyamine antiporter